MNNNENKNEEKKPSALRRFFRLPPLLKIDFDKPVPFKQQFAIMGTVIVISCFLFTGVYAVQLFSGMVVSSEEKAQAADSEQSVIQNRKEADGKSVQTSSAPEKTASEKITKITAAKKDIFKKMTTVVKTQSDVYDGPLILVNKDYPSRLDGENVKLLYEVDNSSYILGDYSVGIAAECVDYFNMMLDDFYALYGETDIMVACGYRSYETQEALQKAEADEHPEAVAGSENDADQWVAPPGYSEHQTGYAFDFDLNLADGGISGIDYDGTGNYSWINKNCGQYGFILRYREGRELITGYQYEPWHFRYVGLPHSQYIEDNDITLEEYLDFVHQHKADNAIIMEDHDGQKWCIYYVPADSSGTTDIPVPEDRTFEISGDNMVNDSSEGYGGFVVTVRLEDGDAPKNAPELKRLEMSVPEPSQESIDLSEEEYSEETQYDDTQDEQYGYYEDDYSESESYQDYYDEYEDYHYDYY